MRITNLEKGENYNLRPDTQIQVERTNPFFNDYGEQTTPLNLPASERNRRLLGFPDSFGRRVKMSAVDVAIQDGEYFAQCRQVVLSAQYKGSISTSFYINDGSFYSRIQNIKLKDIFKDEYIPGVNTVEQGIEFCRSLRANTNEQYGIFPVLLTDDSGLDTGFNYKIMNAYGREITISEGNIWVWNGNTYVEKAAPAVTFPDPDLDDADCDFYNSVQRTEYVREVPITLSPGYYISPFIRANYLLKRIFAHFGYTLLPNFFTQTVPFDKMVVINNVIDVLINGRIKIADLVPDVTCADFIAVFRRKFCCEFMPDEGARTVSVTFLHDAIKQPPFEDLTRCMTAEPVIAYKADKDYRRITLSTEDRLESDIAESYDDIKSMRQACPGAWFNPVDGAFYKTGYSGDYVVQTKIGESSQPYNTGEDIEPREIKIKEIIPEVRKLLFRLKYEGTDLKFNLQNFLFVGPYVTLNSRMVVAENDNEPDAESAGKQPTMLAFSYLSRQRPEGTISPYNLRPGPDGRIVFGRPETRIFDYALYYNGPYGIFERFYRDYDLLLRNSLHDTKIKLLLSQSQKQNLPATAKIIIRGVTFFFNKLKFVLGSKNEPVESELLTVSLMEPVVTAPTISEQLPFMAAKYRWVGHFSQVEVSQEAYLNAGPDKDRTFTTIYPPLPSAEYVGQTFGKQSAFTTQQLQHKSFWRHSKWKYTRTDVWLECIPI